MRAAGFSYTWLNRKMGTRNYGLHTVSRGAYVSAGKISPVIDEQ